MRLEHHGQRDRKREKSCKQCGRTLQKIYPEDLCPVCQEINLFADVKDYIRSNDVKESDVAEHFGIPISKVRAWIREGRIQYKNYNSSKISGVHCQICGKPIDFGNLCAECHHLQGLEVVAKQYGEEKGKMRFMGKWENLEEEE